MILVLADDLSGAAECAAVARHHGLTAEVQTAPDPSARADVVAVDTNSRSLPPPEAAAATARACRVMLAARPTWVFKKVDSVLRGSVAAEVAAALAETGMTRAELVPANPHRGRRVSGGRYYVGGVPLDRTPFADDPECPADSADILTLLRRRSGAPCITHLSVPDVRTSDDLDAISHRLGPGTLPAGGCGLFAALLRTRTAGRDPDPASTSPAMRPDVVLGVRGSAYPGSGYPEAVPVISLDSTRPVGLSADRASHALAVRKAALLTLTPDCPTALRPADRLAALGECAVEVLARVSVGRLLLDGGATGAAILKRLGWTRLTATRSVSSDLVCLRDAGDRSPELFVKPGSYPWVPGVWTRDG